MPHVPRPRRRWTLGGPGLTRVCAWFIAVTVAAFLFYLFAGKATQQQLIEWGALTGDSLLRGHVWKLATTVLIQGSGLTFFFDVLMLWMFVPALERFWGERRFLIFSGVTLLAGNLLAVGVELLLGGPYRLRPIVGITPLIYASIVAFGVVYANQPVQLFGVFPIKGKILAIGTTGVLLLFLLLEQDWIAGASYFGAIGAALAITGGVITPNLWWLKWRRWRIQRRYKVIDGGAGPRRSPDKKQWLN
jgi:membrane associated rhomboid family serine protease